ncbi:hypothetical protein JXL19_02485, partial [bacterium]|nr:hypothetical protein [bacterium]
MKKTHKINPIFSPEKPFWIIPSPFVNRRFMSVSICVLITLIVCISIFLEFAQGSDKVISIRKDTTDLFQNLGGSKAYSKIQIRIKPYKSFRIAFELLMDDDQTLCIYYSSTDIEPQPPEYAGGPIHFGLGSSVIDEKWKIIERDMSLDLENFIVSKIKYIKKIEILGNRYDLAFILACNELDDSDTIVIDDFRTPGQNLNDRGWKSDDINKFAISFDSNMEGYLKAEYTEPDDTNDDQNNTQTPWYVYPYNASYYGGYYGSGLYGGLYGGGYYGSNYYSGG